MFLKPYIFEQNTSYNKMIFYFSSVQCLVLVNRFNAEKKTNEKYL